MVTQNKNFVLFKKHIKNNIVLYAISVFCVLIGIVLGVNVVKHTDHINRMILNLNNYINMLKDNTITFKNLFLNSLVGYLPFVIYIWIFGFTIFGIPFTILLDMYKGYTVGFTFYFLLLVLDYKAKWIVLMFIIFQNVIFIPSVVIFSVISMRFSLKINLKNMNKNKSQSFFSQVISYFITFVIIFCIMSIGFLVEGLTGSISMDILAKNLVH
ncbi:stage II sporulation protein M [Clostridium tepidiprofundi DSM 19306]|uniref:Stage II sporulation protein M n=1 Tax=Clostridium tepidiprofundi DSM 19306 TaxID=1121338 RepID=A0A151B7T5_9CLOT|nr:stage II sporulation protein M [Clostridium tepidiprofundi]KYH35707.1 stage II sporulation protein M [Clostridium tepidiprofundi DSM 19306]